MSLADEAAQALHFAISRVQKELGQKFSDIGEVDALFTWNGQDYRISLQLYSAESPIRKATRKSFQNEPMPAAKEELVMERQFDADQYERMKQGFIPQEMEDRWFIYFDGRSKEFRFHRSWTGFCIFVVKVENDADGGCHIVKSWVNRDPTQYDSDNDLRKAVILVLWLMDTLLLKRDLPFPDL